MSSVRQSVVGLRDPSAGHGKCRQVSANTDCLVSVEHSKTSRASTKVLKRHKRCVFLHFCWHDSSGGMSIVMLEVCWRLKARWNGSDGYLYFWIATLFRTHTCSTIFYCIQISPWPSLSSKSAQSTSSAYIWTPHKRYSS